MDTTQTQFTGLFLKQKMRNYKTGYTVFMIAVGSEVITCTGIIIPPKNQVQVEVHGRCWKRTPYGLQLTDCTLHEAITDRASMQEFLLHIQGVGSTTAEQVCANVGPGLFRLAEEPNAAAVLADKAGIILSKAELIIEHIRKNQVQTKLFSLVTHFGGAYHSAEKIYAKYEANAMRALTSNPYQVGTAANIPFSVCDSIAKSFGVATMNQQRIIAAINAVMEREASHGNTYLPVEDAIKSARKLLGSSASEHSISSVVIANAAVSGNDTLLVERNNLYLRYLYWQEVQTAYALKRLIKNGIHTECDPDELCAYAESVCHVKYAKQQREIFKAIAHGGVCVLTGGPGTGKTTVVKGFLTAYEKVFPEKTIRLCAPTGRASQRMHEATGREATTIHRLIEFRPFGDTAICKNEADPIDADCIVVDESSMISIDVAALLFSAIRSGTLVLLVGDVNQLPSVGPGNVLADIIRSGIVPVVALTETQRQGADSPIIVNAKRIQDGDPDLVTDRRDFRIISAEDTSIPDIVQELYSQYHDSTDPFKVQVLCPSRKNRLTGSIAISRIIQQTVNSGRYGIHYGNSFFSLGDKIMMTQNNYNVGYFNGDVGIIKRITGEGITILLNGSDMLIPHDCLDDMILSYATTVHKSQGSEYDTVIVALPSEPINMLQRNILYTAITRAKKGVIIVAAENAISTAICTEKTTKRNTSLVSRLTKSFPNRSKEEPEWNK